MLLLQPKQTKIRPYWDWNGDSVFMDVDNLATKIRPYWDWNKKSKWDNLIKTEKLKSDHIGIEIYTGRVDESYEE